MAIFPRWGWGGELITIRREDIIVMRNLRHGVRLRRKQGPAARSFSYVSKTLCPINGYKLLD
jgi:hypothetical protein